MTTLVVVDNDIRNNGNNSNFIKKHDGVVLIEAFVLNPVKATMIGGRIPSSSGKFSKLHIFVGVPTEVIEGIAVAASSAATTAETAAAAASSVSSVIVAAAGDDAKDYGELAKTAAIALVLGGGLIPALIGANTQMVSTLSGRKGLNLAKDEDPANTFDPYVASGNSKVDQFREYVYDSGSQGPDLPKSGLLFAQDRISLVDIIAVLGRIQSVESMNVDWKSLPSARRGGVADTSNPPMWLPRQAFKVAIRESPKWYGWPIDKNTGEPIGGQALKSAEEKRISKRGAVIGDAALDVVFDSWSWGASIATPDKVQSTLKLFYGDNTNSNNKNPAVIDLDSFVNAAIRGRSNTAIAAITFIVIQLIVFGSLFLKPLLEFF